MLITKNQSKITLPDDWTKTDENNPDYFESPDGTRGIYITSHENDNFDSDRLILEYVLKIEKEKTDSMKDYKFLSWVDSTSSVGDTIVGYLDQLDQGKNYRIASKCLVKQQKIFRAVLHDYDCRDYEKSKRESDHILDSFVYLPKYMWIPTDDKGAEFKNEAVVLKDEGFLDIDLYIASHTAYTDGSILINIANTHKEKPIGFAICIHSRWIPKKIDNSEASFFWGTGKFINCGQPTENFIQSLAGLYGISAPPIFKSEVDIAIVGLANDPKKLAQQNIKMKLFFNSENQELYSEVFLNVNLQEKTLEFHEKDQEYRQPLIRSLCGEV